MSREHFDIIITDIKMPGMDGATFYRQVRQHDPVRRIIFITGDTVNSDTQPSSSASPTPCSRSLKLGPCETPSSRSYKTQPTCSRLPTPIPWASWLADSSDETLTRPRSSFEAAQCSLSSRPIGPKPQGDFPRASTSRLRSRFRQRICVCGDNEGDAVSGDADAPEGRIELEAEARVAGGGRGGGRAIRERLKQRVVELARFRGAVPGCRDLDEPRRPSVEHPAVATRAIGAFRAAGRLVRSPRTRRSCQRNSPMFARPASDQPSPSVDSNGMSWTGLAPSPALYLSGCSTCSVVVGMFPSTGRRVETSGATLSTKQ